MHRHLGPGLQEPLYAPALQIELSLRSIPFQSEVILPVSYKGHPLGKRKIDLLIDSADCRTQVSGGVGTNSHGTVDRVLKIDRQAIGLVDQFQRPVA